MIGCEFYLSAGREAHSKPTPSWGRQVQLTSSPKSAAQLPIPTATPLAHLGDIVPERSEW